MSDFNEQGVQTVREGYQYEKKESERLKRYNIQEISPRFRESNKQNYDNNNRETTSNEQQILFNLSKQSLVNLLLQTRLQLNQSIINLHHKQQKIKKLKFSYKEAIRQRDKLHLQNQKLLDTIQNITNSKSYHTQSHKSTQYTKQESYQTTQFDTQTSFLQEIFKITNSQNYNQSLLKIKTLKQSSKFICSLYKLIDEYTKQKYFNGNYTLTSAWTFVKKIFKEYFDENWIKSNSVVCQMQQILNCNRQQLSERVLNLMRDISRLNRVLQKFKIQYGLFWINDINYLQRYLSCRKQRNNN